MSQVGLGVEGLISILIPTRGRPQNVRKVVSSAMATAKYPDSIEFLFYVDDDDSTFPSDVLTSQVKVIIGPRLWISLAHIILYSHCKGEIIMYAADDLIFRSENWDEIIKERFSKTADKIRLVYGNDGVLQSQNIARHAFVHRNWINAVGSSFPSGREMPSDLWYTEVARGIGRLDYLDDLIIEHVHYRQGGAAKFDFTYKEAAARSRSWASRETYKKLGRERRIDRILLSEVMDQKPKTERAYVLGELLANHKSKFRLDTIDARRLRSIKNHIVIFLVIKTLIKKIFVK